MQVDAIDIGPVVSQPANKGDAVGLDIDRVVLAGGSGAGLAEAGCSVDAPQEPGYGLGGVRAGCSQGLRHCLRRCPSTSSRATKTIPY